MCNNKWLREKEREMKLSKSMLRKEPKLILLYRRWLMRITKWWELIKWNKIKVNKTWYSVLPRREHFLIDKDNLKSTKRSSLENSLNHNKIELIICKQWKKPLKDKERLFSLSLKEKKPREELNLKVSNKWETIFTLKNKRRKPDDKKLLTTPKKFNKKKSSKPLKITNSNLRPKD